MALVVQGSHARGVPGTGLASRGFTLLELLVAVAIFAVVATLAWGGLDAIVRSRRVLDDEAAQLAKLQRAFGRFERDMGAALPRPVRNERNQMEAALAGDAQRLDASTGVPATALSTQAPALQRVAWSCHDGELRRTRWAAPDRTGATASEDQVLLEGLARCRLRYLAQDGLVAERWPLPGMPANALPQGIELELRIEGRGQFRRVIELVQAPGVAQ